MAKENTTLAEPNIQEIGSAAEASHPAFTEMSSILAAASSMAAKPEGDAGAALKEGLQKQAEAGGERAATPPAHTTQTEPAKDTQSGLQKPESEIKRAAVAAADEPREEGSALEDFRQQAMEERQKVFREFQQKKASEGKEPPAPAKTEATTTTEPGKEQSAQTTAETPVTMDEVEKELNNQNLSKRHQERMRFLHAKAKRADELEAKVKEIETKAGNAQTIEEFQKLQQQHENATKELLRYRRRYELESDPDLKQKFDAVIESNNDAVLNKLKEVGLSEKTVNLIKEHGSLDGFIRANKVFTVPVKDENTGDTRNVQMTSGELVKQWLSDMSLADSKFIEAKMIEQYNLQEGKRREMKRLANEAETYFKQQSEQAKKQQEAYQQSLQENIKKVEQFGNELFSKNDLAKEIVIQPTATEAERQYAEAHNAAVAQARETLKLATSVSDLPTYLKLVERAATQPLLQSELNRLQRQNAALQAQLSQFNQAVRTTPRSGSSQMMQAAPPPKKQSTADSMKISAAEAIRQDMERMQAGGQYSSEDE